MFKKRMMQSALQEKHNVAWDSYYVLLVLITYSINQVSIEQPESKVVFTVEIVLEEWAIVTQN